MPGFASGNVILVRVTVFGFFHKAPSDLTTSVQCPAM